MSVDSREPKDIIEHLKGLGACVGNLAVADYIVETENKVILIERKELNDARQSMRDGRWTDQKTRMTSVSMDKPTMLVLLIEGTSSLSDELNGYTLHANQMQHAIISACVLDSFYVIMCATREDTMNTLEYIGKITSSDYVRQRKTFGLTPKQHISHEIFKHQLMLILGVSEDAAGAITNVYKTYREFYEGIQTKGLDQMVKEVAEMSKGTRKIGKKVSERIFSALGF